MTIVIAFSTQPNGQTAKRPPMAHKCRTGAESVRGGHWNTNEKKEELSLEASTAYRSTTVVQEEVQGERATDTDSVSLPTETSHPFKSHVRDEHSNAEGKSADRKDGGAYEIQGTYFVVGMSLLNFGLQWKLVRIRARHCDDGQHEKMTSSLRSHCNNPAV